MAIAHQITVPVISQRAGNMTGSRRPQMQILLIDPSDLTQRLKKSRAAGLDERATLHAACLDNPATDSSFDSEDIAVAKQKFLTCPRIDTDHEYILWNAAKDAYELKSDVSAAEVITVWPKAIWAAVFAARKGLTYHETLEKYTIDELKDEGY